MPRINLLPWRDAERKRKRQEFAVGMAGALIVALLIGFLAQLKWQAAIDYQKERNAYIESQIAEVDKQIVEIVALDQQKSRLLARMDVIKKLQSSRPEEVHLFDQLVRTIPDGVYFTAIKQTGANVQINGVAQSSTRVAALMRNLDASEWLSVQKLEKIETKGNTDGGSEFALYATLTSRAASEAETEVGKSAAQRKRAGMGQ